MRMESAGSGAGMGGALGAIGMLNMMSNMVPKKATQQKKRKSNKFGPGQRVPKVADGTYGIAYIPSDPTPVEKLRTPDVSSYKVKGKESMGPRDFGDV